MKKLENFVVQELTTEEMCKINGGSLWDDIKHSFDVVVNIGEVFWDTYGDSIEKSFNDFW